MIDAGQHFAFAGILFIVGGFVGVFLWFTNPGGAMVVVSLFAMIAAGILIHTHLVLQEETRNAIIAMHNAIIDLAEGAGSDEDDQDT